MLVALNLDKKIRMEVNTLYYATGGVLSIECEDGQWDRKELQDLWQRNISGNKEIRKLEIFIKRC